MSHQVGLRQGHVRQPDTWRWLHPAVRPAKEASNLGSSASVGVFKRPKVPKPRRQMGSLVVRMTKNHPNISKVHENLWLRFFFPCQVEQGTFAAILSEAISRQI